MVFSYQFDVAGIMVILTSLICAWIRPRLMKNFSVYLKLIIVLSIMYNILDIITSVLIQIKKPGTWLITYILLLAYFIVLYMFPYRGTLYFYELCGEKVNPILLRGSLAVMLLLATFGNIFFNFLFEYDRYTMEYKHGVGFYATFIYYLIFVFLVGDCAIKHKRYLGKIRLRLLTAILGITVVDVIYQLIFPMQSITGLVIALSVAMTVVVFCFVDVTVDELTGLNNRAGFIRACDELMHNQDVTGYSMIKIQVYHMQELNERTGMENGDKVLMMLASNVKYCTDIARKKSVCGRIGGDTFAILTDSEITINALSKTTEGDVVQNPLTGMDYAVSFYAGGYKLENGDSILKDPRLCR